MDTLQVSSIQPSSGSRHSSRTPSPSRYAQAEIQQSKYQYDLNICARNIPQNILLI